MLRNKRKDHNISFKRLTLIFKSFFALDFLILLYKSQRKTQEIGFESIRYALDVVLFVIYLIYGISYNRNFLILYTGMRTLIHFLYSWINNKLLLILL